MRPLGFSGAPSLLIDAGSGATLRAGVSVSVTVLERVSPGLYRILAGGEVLMARSEIPLEAGSILKAKAEKLPGLSGLLLRLEPQPRFQGQAAQGLDALLSRLQLPSDIATRLAASALLAEGLAPTQASILRVRRAMSGLASSGGKDGEESGSPGARLAARMEAKGLEATPEALSSLQAASDGRSGSDQGGQDREGREPAHGKGQGGGRGEGECVAPADGAADVDGALSLAAASGLAETSLPSEDLAKGLGSFLRGLCMRTAVEGGNAGVSGGGAYAALGLYNHARAAAGGRIIVPFRFSLDSVAFAGSFHILLPYIVGGPGRLEARFRTDREGLEASGVESQGSAEWRFDLAFGSGTARLVLGRPRGADGRSHAGKAFEELFRELAASFSESGCAVTIAGEEADTGEGVDVDA